MVLKSAGYRANLNKVDCCSKYSLAMATLVSCEDVDIVLTSNVSLQLTDYEIVTLHRFH